MAIFERDPWILDVYRTYSGPRHLYVRGRALEDQPLKHFEQQTLYQTLRNTWRTFATDEIRSALVVLTLPNGKKFETKADHEGYFLFDLKTDFDLYDLIDDEGYLSISVAFDEDNAAFAKAKQQKRLKINKFPGETLIPPIDAGFGVISDIDDTIMHTGVTSFLKLRVAFNTFFKNYDRRLPLKGAASFYQLLHRGASSKAQNPMFYLSNSPWNLYKYLEKFLDFHGFPKGPILLRDFPTPWDRTPKLKRPHKEHELLNILKHYPNMKFILIGDSGEHDADYYINVAQQYPERILAIYLRSVNHRRKMLRVQSKANNFDICPMLLVKESKEAVAHARSMGWIV
ncbi:App1 family protein [Nonlabens xiamenensis]|uniref:App1 family protein n=1 Tax=Nonlabens xiamenensis TaxID=2341043 RepID=UPI000F60E29C|nr:phosphatase domain-containing protein [Nonlabens xiamenensis]